MPSKQTQNYKLSQWVKTDKVLMDDFNADNKKIDDAIKAVDVRVDSKVDTSALEALKQTVNGHTSTLDRKGNCRVESSSYTGDRTGSDVTFITKVIQFSAKPLFFIITGPGTLVFGGSLVNQAYAVFSLDGRAANGTITATWSGNSVSLYGDSRAVPNSNGVSYLVTAFYAQDA